MDYKIVQNILRQNGISSTIIKRGYELYKGNAIKEYRLDIDSINYKIRIYSKVLGTKLYEEFINLSMEDDFTLNLSRCSCPFNYYDVCKHSAAVLIKFLMEDYIDLSHNIEDLKKLKEKKELYKSFTSFVNKIDFINEKTQIEYRVKGFEKMVNFKVFMDLKNINEETKVDFFKNMFNDYHNFSFYIPYLTQEDYNIIKLFKSLSPKVNTKDFSLTINKDKNSIILLKELMTKGKLLNEKNQKITYGGFVKPEIFIDGNEEEIEIKTLTKPESYYEANDAAWIFKNNIFYEYDNSLNHLNQKINIPPDEAGKFLFVYLKKIKKEYNAQLCDYLENLKLINNSPRVKFILDYDNDYIVFENLVSFNKNLYKNSDIEENLPYELHNSMKKINDSTWEKIDLSPVIDMFDFINNYKIYAYQDKFAIMDKNEIQKFLTFGLPHLPEDWEIETTESFNSLKIEELELEPIIEFKEQEDKIDWFEFSIKYLIDGKYYSKKELNKLIEYNENGEAFIKIGAKYFIIKETEAENKVKAMTENAELKKDGTYESSYFNMLYYRKLIKSSGIEFRGNKIFDEMDRDISDLSILDDIEIPQEVDKVLRPYQKEGYKWLNFLYKFRFGGILADDMGLGKTLQTLSFLRNIEKSNPSLIVVPKSLVYNWKNECEKFFPQMTLMIYEGSLAQRRLKIEQMKDFDLIVTSFDLAARDHEELEKIKFLYLVLDEAHNIKNRTTKRTGNIKKIKSQYRLALTGTPLENSLEELWSIFDFVIPGYFGSFKKFSEEYLKAPEHKERLMIELKNKITPFMLRRKKEEVLKELPDKMESIIRVEMNEEQNIAYNLILDKVKSDLESLITQKGFNNSQISILAALTKLRQICNHPNLVFEDNEKVYESAKLETLLELIKESIYAGHKILVFSQFVQMLKLIKERLLEDEIEFEYLDGSTKNRMDVVNSFNDDENKKVFLLSLKAGGTGLNLTSADIVIHVDPWWNPQIERQATDRAHRMGQEKKVIVYKLITKGTVEEKMLKLQERKKEIFDVIIDSNNNSLSKVTWSDIQELLSIE